MSLQARFASADRSSPPAAVAHRDPVGKTGVPNRKPFSPKGGSEGRLQECRPGVQKGAWACRSGTRDCTVQACSRTASMQFRETRLDRSTAGLHFVFKIQLSHRYY